jgi:YesN/AraC family two-component response regulator
MNRGFGRWIPYDAQRNGSRYDCFLAMKRILFVDDDPAILAGLRNLFYKDSMRWDMVFALGGEDALGEARKQRFDVVVSDQGMPGIDGMTLLSAINAEHPETALVLLSGYVDIEPTASALPTLQLLSKPCDTATLREAIERSIGPPAQIDGVEGCPVA